MVIIYSFNLSAAPGAGFSSNYIISRFPLPITLAFTVLAIIAVYVIFLMKFKERLRDSVNPIAAAAASFLRSLILIYVLCLFPALDPINWNFRNIKPILYAKLPNFIFLTLFFVILYFITVSVNTKRSKK